MRGRGLVVVIIMGIWAPSCQAGISHCTQTVRG